MSYTTICRGDIPSAIPVVDKYVALLEDSDDHFEFHDGGGAPEELTLRTIRTRVSEERYRGLLSMLRHGMMVGLLGIEKQHER